MSFKSRLYNIRCKIRQRRARKGEPGCRFTKKWLTSTFDNTNKLCFVCLVKQALIGSHAIPDSGLKKCFSRSSYLRSAGTAWNDTTDKLWTKPLLCREVDSDFLGSAVESQHQYFFFTSKKMSSKTLFWAVTSTTPIDASMPVSALFVFYLISIVFRALLQLAFAGGYLEQTDSRKPFEKWMTKAYLLIKRVFSVSLKSTIDKQSKISEKVVLERNDLDSLAKSIYFFYDLKDVGITQADAHKHLEYFHSAEECWMMATSGVAWIKMGRRHLFLILPGSPQSIPFEAGDLDIQTVKQSTCLGKIGSSLIIGQLSLPPTVGDLMEKQLDERKKEQEMLLRDDKAMADLGENWVTNGVDLGSDWCQLSIQEKAKKTLEFIKDPRSEEILTNLGLMTAD